MKFSQVNKMRISKGSVKRIKCDGDVLWSPILARYVSLGDSIAAGHTIDGDWETDYGEGSQYGKNGNTETVIVPGSYTDLIRDDLTEIYGGRVFAASFARSGDTVADLMEKLDHAAVRNAIAKANLVTLCIGANDVLQPAMSSLGEYINTGDLSGLAAIVEANMAVLADDTAAASYTALFNKLTGINPNAKYVFTTVYNPYKYLWIEDGHNGFFGPLLNTIPQMTILGFEVDALIKDGLLSTSYVQLLFNRVNGLGDWAEKYVTLLNQVLRDKIRSYANPNFLLADTKAVFDPVPDRPIAADRHYNDLVNVEYTRGYDAAKMDWGRLWEGSNAGAFWLDLATEHISFSGLDIGGFAEDLVAQIIEKVIVPDVDPHPEVYGQYALERSFADALGWSALPRRTITFNANGGSGAMASQVVVALDNMTAYANINANAFAVPAEGYYFTGWNTAADGSGTAYTNGQFVGLTGDMTLYAQWSNMYTLTYTHSYDSIMVTDSDTGFMEGYALWINGVEQADLGAFSNPAVSYRLPYGTSIKVNIMDDVGDSRSYVTWNGTKVAGNGNDVTYEFALTGNLTINFEYNRWGYELLDNMAKYWNCYITTN